jgi:hypothetical protein
LDVAFHQVSDLVVASYMAQQTGLRNPEIGLRGRVVGMPTDQAGPSAGRRSPWRPSLRCWFRRSRPAFAAAGPIPNRAGVICTAMGLQDIR